MGQPRIRVLVVDDQPVFASALAVRLGVEPDLEVIAAVQTAEAAELSVLRQPPDVAIVDVVLGTSDGIALVARLLQLCPDLKIIVLTGEDSIDRVAEAVLGGARAWVPKTVPSGELVAIVRGVAEGEVHIAPQLLAAVLSALLDRGAGRAAAARPIDTLSARERQVLQGFVDGKTRADIASMLHVSPNTVRSHTQNLMSKLGAHSALEAVAVALASGVRPSAAEPAGRHG